MLELLSTIGVALGLGAAAGLRVFVPLLIASVATKLGFITPGAGMEWLGSWWAVALFATLSLAEAIAFHVPWVDHALDAVAAPLAVVSGTLVAAAPLLHTLGVDGAASTTNQLLPWAAALVGGGVPAAGVQLASMTTRAASTATTLGTANPIVATIESVGATILSILAILLPILAGVLVLGVIALVLYWARRRRSARARLALAS